MNNDKNNSLLLYVSNNDYNNLKQLLLTNTDININHKDGFAISTATTFGYFEIVKLLINHGADINIKNSQALYNSIYCNYDIALFLIENKIKTENVYIFIEKMI